uniref:RING-type E3 ubiquitin transferase n=1 Tax=Amphilophus citrinellus TaxID=61819 RepID=A0A3Q0SCZ1_AMPCI
MKKTERIKIIFHTKFTPFIRGPQEIFNRWCDIPADIKREAAQRMKICSFWLPILLDREESITVCWAIEIGLISASEDLSLKHLRRIEIVEVIFRALEKGFVSSASHSSSVLHSFLSRTAEALDDAFHWLVREGEPDIQKRVLDLGAGHTCFIALHHIFTECKAHCLLFEEMKKKGNEHFEKQQYEEAVKYYSKAIKHYPDNHKLYGNRALSYIRCKEYLCSSFLVSVQGHYRYCEALFSLGQHKMAIKANQLAQLLCKDDHEGVKELETQLYKFTVPQPVPQRGPPRGYVSGEPPSKSEPNTTAKKKSKIKNGHPEKEVSTFSYSKPLQSHQQCCYIKRLSSAQNQVVVDSKISTSKELRSIVEDAHTALTDLRSRNAEQAFSKALALLEAVTPRVSLLPAEELTEAEKLLQKIKSYEERTFQCLVYYAIGKLYLRENRFAVALEQFSDSLQMFKNQITPGKLTWPLTKEIVKETQPDYFKGILEDAIELCKFPPTPDAICRLDKCLCPVKAEIYFTDPDFKGFIRLCCCQHCTVEYHITCWKSLKTSAFAEKNEKDLLQEACLTPNCVGQICSIKIFGPTGLVKCKVSSAIPKLQTVKKPKVNQKCTSVKKLKSKEEQKLKRKQHKQSFQDKEDKENLQRQEDSAAQSQQKVYRDRVLLQISQNVELLREEKGLHISVVFGSLKPWLELDSARGNQIAGRMLNWQQEQLETLGQVVELLLERKNRVWARVFIQELSSCVAINPKLSNWACRLNDGGLNAAQSFIERYAGRLEQLDLSLLLKFGPLQDMIIEKLGTSPELFSSIGLTVTEYLKQAPPHDMRLFIWTLEEHRDEFVSCHTILDEYFDMLDGHCSVLKKSDDSKNVSNSPIKAKSRGRKKKQREPKGVIVLSGMRAVTPRDEWDQEFFEEDSLSFLDALDPFSVPSHLREQVAEFEEQYDGTRHRTHYKKILDNNPDSTKESLYDYFAQILEEHGPLAAEDPLLVGELENFPPEAKLKIGEAGGFEPFLLDSLRFIKIGRCIGLAKHAVSLQQAENGSSLDDLDVIADPDISGDETGFTSYLNDFSSAHTEIYPMLPNPYVFGYHKFDIYKYNELKCKIFEFLMYFFPLVKVTNKELTLFQQKLEEEVKKDQKEKKANQEALKSLKQEIEELMEQQGSNQSAAEKMSLEDEIKRSCSLTVQGNTGAAVDPAAEQSHIWTKAFECKQTEKLRMIKCVNPVCVLRSELMRFVQELRSYSGGSFSSMTMQDVVGGVTQLILDHQVDIFLFLVFTPLRFFFFFFLRGLSERFLLNVEDPCIICHEDMSPDDTCVLECRHSFHNECIRSWLKEQSTCPTCRNHALLPEDFPMLTGRRRPAP